MASAPQSESLGLASARQSEHLGSASARQSEPLGRCPAPVGAPDGARPVPPVSATTGSASSTRPPRRRSPEPDPPGPWTERRTSSAHGMCGRSTRSSGSASRRRTRARKRTLTANNNVGRDNLRLAATNPLRCAGAVVLCFGACMICMHDEHVVYSYTKWKHLS